MSRKKKEIILENVRIESVAAEGKAIARIDGTVLFVQFAVPGDIVDVKVTKKKKNYMEGFILRMVSPSPDRLEPFCSHFGVCGGCKWQPLPYPMQLEAKQQQAEQYDAMKERIQYMYENSSNNNYLAMLLTSGDISEFLNRAEYIQQVSSYDRTMLEEYMSTVETVEAKEDQVQQEQEEIRNLQEQSDQKQEAVQEMYAATYQELRTYNEQLDSAMSSQSELVAEINAQQETLNGLIKQAKEEEIAAQKKAEEEAAAKAAAEQAARQQQSAQSSSNTSSQKTDSSDSTDSSSTTVQESEKNENSSSGTYLGKFRVTGYCACSICCGDWAGGTTASGTTPTPGRTVAMGGVPFGTKLMINGQIYTVEDRGTAYGHVDMFFGSHSEALAFGSQYVDVYQVG